MPKKLTQKKILKEIEKDKIRKYLIEKYGMECFYQAKEELEPELKKLRFWEFSKFNKLKEKIFQKSKEILDNRFKDVLR